jgi:O-antigen/teichoic acid export membrane protein
VLDLSRYRLAVVAFDTIERHLEPETATLQRFAGGAVGRNDWGTALGVYHQACRITALLGLLVTGLLLAISTPLAETLLEPEQRTLLIIVSLAVVPFAWFGIQAAMLKAIGHPAWGGLQDLVRHSTRLMILFSMPLVVLLMVAGEPILTLFGTEFGSAYELLMVLLLRQLINIITGPVGHLLTMTGHEQTLRNLLLLMLPLTLVLCLLLIPAYGALGAAWAIALPMILENLICCWLVKKRLGLPFWLVWCNE